MTSGASNLYVDDNGWCLQAKRFYSPNYDARPAGLLPSLLVIHNISLPPGQYGGTFIFDLFANTLDYDAHPYFAQLRGLHVSSHFLIQRNGVVSQFVSANDRAWHAGSSSFGGRELCNDFSIGVELEGTDYEAFALGQYTSLSLLTVALQRRYPLTDVIGHEHIAPVRKTDPGPCFDWLAYQASLERLQTGADIKLRFPLTP
jgi:N-acetyl-anhydromuramoyl-L-alanine amidase